MLLVPDPASASAQTSDKWSASYIDVTTVNRPDHSLYSSHNLAALSILLEIRSMDVKCSLNLYLASAPNFALKPIAHMLSVAPFPL
ncbi:uncharacterized protein ARMOST_12273 [Armillaria ostoyae]|uniref:Uncharacterized protein n=1 Tax=Armillaria ostoyae TaxID=47428 RepID=A0A284RJF5_ARMOS|nr:uncharacterized protein ARMOST_12273 [Armillaria ostoyae]